MVYGNKFWQIAQSVIYLDQDKARESFFFLRLSNSMRKNKVLMTKYYRYAISVRPQLAESLVIVQETHC